MSRTVNLRNQTEGPDDDPAGPADFPFLAPPAADGEIGRLGNYRVLKLLGQGGMAFVFQAEDVALRRPVALKVMRPELEQDPDGWERFLREARLMASLKHQHLVTVYQAGIEGRLPYLAMELLQGESLDGRIRRAGKIRLSEVLRLGREIAAGLAAIHAAGLIHRDVKPANIWLEGPEARVKILDFGLARVAQDDARLTRSGWIVGTPAFMSPEQARGESLDARSDLFSLGCILYELCSGRRPFEAPTTMAALTALAVKDPSPLHEIRVSVPRPLSDLIMQLLAKDRDGRPASAEEVLARLRVTGDRPAAPRTARAAPKPLPTAPKLVVTAPKPVSATLRQAPPKSKTRLRQKKARDTRRRRLTAALLVGVPILAVLTVGSALLIPAALGRPNAAAPLAPAAAVFLSDRTPADNNNPISTPPAPTPRPGEPPPPPFRGVMVRGQSSPHGIFMHPPLQPNGGSASLRYRLGGQFHSFTAEVSLNDGPPESETPLTFSVYGDGRLLWQSHPIRRQADAERCDVSVRGVDMLVIQVDCPGSPRGAHAVWVEPGLTP